MFIPAPGISMNYKYVSQFVNFNISLSVTEIELNCRLITFEGPFMGKYFLIASEDDENISILRAGKGLFYGKITESDLENPIFKINKINLLSDGIKITEKDTIKTVEGEFDVEYEGIKFERCKMLTLDHNNGKYLFYIKDGIGLISIENYFNGTIREYIIKKEA
ncbi:hypothetical protein [Fonticella tunisiensis]|uniref:Uncharacterized protein n=1 Tax=Fonticella tunisiensis TaxID=1096341 RepID=A0A4R7KP05_9CLOT|nr:hypothetical protein [Fonticella tunisiensis]TDT58422.1 hypothetical protein EDD71_11170 [Fonticella tunisiensis]